MNQSKQASTNTKHSALQHLPSYVELLNFRRRPRSLEKRPGRQKLVERPYMKCFLILKARWYPNTPFSVNIPSFLGLHHAIRPQSTPRNSEHCFVVKNYMPSPSLVSLLLGLQLFLFKCLTRRETMRYRNSTSSVSHLHVTSFHLPKKYCPQSTELPN